MKKPSLTIKGKFSDCLSKVDCRKSFLVRRFCSGNQNGTLNQKFDWGDALIDAIITSGITFFSALGGGSVTGISDIHIIESAAVAAFSQFFVFLALKRGLVNTEKP